MQRLFDRSSSRVGEKFGTVICTIYCIFLSGDTMPMATIRNPGVAAQTNQAPGASSRDFRDRVRGCLDGLLPGPARVSSRRVP